jgi:hypothetical protein
MTQNKTPSSHFLSSQLHEFSSDIGNIWGLSGSVIFIIIMFQNLPHKDFINVTYKIIV